MQAVSKRQSASVLTILDSQQIRREVIWEKWTSLISSCQEGRFKLYIRANLPFFPMVRHTAMPSLNTPGTVSCSQCWAHFPLQQQTRGKHAPSQSLGAPARTAQGWRPQQRAEERLGSRWLHSMATQALHHTLRPATWPLLGRYPRLLAVSDLHLTLHYSNSSVLQLGWGCALNMAS